MRTIIRNDYTPELGDYHERIVIDETKGKHWLFDCDGVFTDITGSDVEIANEFGDKTGAAISQKFFTDTVRAEIAAREEADTTLAGDILAERTARMNADAALQAAVSAEQTARQNADTNLQNQIDGIEEVIPAQASASNQLADKDFVNSSVATNTANYISNNGQPFTSVAELEAYSGPLTNNDYAFVTGTDAQGNTFYDRYKYNANTGEWAFEYELNNSSFTAAQWATINSGITSGDVTKLQGLANIQTIGANLTLTNGELSATDTTYTAGTGIDITNGVISATSTGPTVVQTTGTSTTDVMSQNATTSMVYADPGTNQVVNIGGSTVNGSYATAIGKNTSTNGNYAVALGSYSRGGGAGSVAVGGGASSQVRTEASGNYSVSIGSNALASGTGSIALGRSSVATRQGEMNIGSSNTSYGYNNSFYRLLSGLYDGQSDHDAVTVGQLNTAIAGAGAAEINSTDWSALWQ